MRAATRPIAPIAALLAATLTAVACADGGTAGPTGPPPPAPDLIQSVIVRITGLEITGSCDHDSVFESSSDGEFSFSFEVTPRGSQTTRVWSVADRKYTERTHDTGGQSTRFNRNVTRGEDFEVQFRGTEYDGLLGADSDFNGKFAGRSFQYENGAWTGGTSHTLTLSGNKSRCGARIHFTVTSQEVG